MSDQAIINEVLSLYQLKPTNESYAHYAQNAVFHDPVSIAEGLDSIKSQFNGMPKVFEKSETQSELFKTSSPPVFPSRRMPVRFY